jgi:hypothetical protein
VQQRQWRTQQLGRAVRWRSRRVQHAAFSSWNCICLVKKDQAQKAQALWRRRLLNTALKVGRSVPKSLILQGM